MKVMQTRTFLIKTIQILSVLFLAGVLYVNYLSVTLPINGITTEEVSDKYSNLFTPAAITFSVWGVIYLGLVMYVIWQLQTLFSSKYLLEVDLVVRKIGVLFLITCLLNVAWLYAWHYEKLFYSVLIMAGLLFSLISINKRISFELPNTPQYKLFLKVPFGMYLGWISIAFISNVAAYLTKTGWEGLGLDPRFWQMAMVTFATVISCWAVSKLNNVAYGLVVLWALGGLLMFRISDGMPSITVTLLITVCALIILITTINRIKRWTT